MSKLNSPVVCPHCGYNCDAASNLDCAEARPSPGDPNVCINCAQISVYTDDLQLRIITSQDLAMYDDELVQEIGQIQSIIMKVSSSHG